MLENIYSVLETLYQPVDVGKILIWKTIKLHLCIWIFSYYKSQYNHVKTINMTVTWHQKRVTTWLVKQKILKCVWVHVYRVKLKKAYEHGW